MARESHIDASDGFFAGEDKTLLWRVRGEVDGIEEWDLALELYAPRARPSDAPLFTLTNTSGVTAAPAPPDEDCATVTAVVTGDRTVSLAPQVYQYVLWRTDPGSKQVLAYGGLALQTAVRA